MSDSEASVGRAGGRVPSLSTLVLIALGLGVLVGPFFGDGTVPVRVRVPGWDS